MADNRITYYAAVPVHTDDDGGLAPGEGVQEPTKSAAIARARQLAESHAGAIAFSRSGDPQLGDYDDAVILACFGAAASSASRLLSELQQKAA